MHNLLAQYVEEYDLNLSRHHASGDGGNILNNPLLYVVIGEKSREVLAHLQASNKQKWNNDKGVFYLFIGHEQFKSPDNLQTFSLPFEGNLASESNPKTIRKQIATQFEQSFDYLISLNQIITALNNEIASRGNIYQNFEQLNISVISRADDPFTVLIPHIIVLLKSMLGEAFKHIQLDLFCLIYEKEQQDLEKALGIAFLHEMDQFQQPTFQYEKQTRVTKELIKMDVKHGPRSLFDLVYIIGDKNYEGKFVDSFMTQSSQIVCNINLLKTRATNINEHNHNYYYNNEKFKREISLGNVTENYLVSAGFSKIGTPHRAISTVVLDEVMKYIEQKSSYSAKTDQTSIKSILNVSQDQLTQLVYEFLPNQITLDDLKSVMYKSQSSADELNYKTLEEVERELFGHELQHMFDKNIVNKIEQNIENKDWYNHVKYIIEHNVIHVPQYGLFCAYEWISDRSEHSILPVLVDEKRDIDRQIYYEQQQLMQLLSNQAYVKTNVFSMFRKDKVYKEYVKQIVEVIYAKKLDIVLLQAKAKVLAKCIAQYSVLQEEYLHIIQRFQSIRKDVRDLNRQYNKPSNNYIDLNISEYYGKIVQDILIDMESKYSPNFIFEQEGIGNIAKQLSKVDDFIQNLISFSKRNILKHAKFQMPFEQELLERTGINIKYDEKHRVMSKEDIYDDLYKDIEMQSTVQIHLYNYKQKINYFESYLFADEQSEFVTYYRNKQSIRKNTLGCIHEEQSSAVEKLTLMGGFKIQDTMYYINGKKIYDVYVQNEFEFHSKPVVSKG